MAGKTLTRADLADAVVQKVGLPRNESQDLVELILNEISATLALGDQVKLSSFGSFGIREKGQRVGRNPKTGKEVPITPRRVLVFRPSNVMKERINAGAKRAKDADGPSAKPARKAGRPAEAIARSGYKSGKPSKTKSASSPMTTSSAAATAKPLLSKSTKAQGKLTPERQA